MYIKLEVTDSKDQSGYWIPVIFTGAASFVVSWIIFGKLVNLKWLKIWLAPKVYLLEYLAEFVK